VKIRKNTPTNKPMAHPGVSTLDPPTPPILQAGAMSRKRVNMQARKLIIVETESPSTIKGSCDVEM
jgi:hypothetical protein